MKFACTVLLLGAALCAQPFDEHLFNGLRWREIGPFRGGRAMVVAGVPGNPAIYYMGTPGGGVWKTTDGGIVWKPIFDRERSPSIGALAVAPSNPNILYVGTGDVNDIGESCGAPDDGDGIYRSDDAGRTWRHIGLEGTRHIGGVWIDPRDPEIALAAALGNTFVPGPDRGVYRTTDGGRHWQKVLYQDDHSGGIDLSSDTTTPQTIYAALWDAHRNPHGGIGNGPGSKLYRSDDGGKTWAAVAGAGLPSGNLERLGVSAVAGRVYLVTGGPESGLFRSENKGESWQRMTLDPRVPGRSWYDNWFFAHVTADPRNPDVVYTMGTSIYRSADGGHTFTAFKGAPGGDDYHALWIDPRNSGRMIAGSDQGAVISMDGGETWSSWYNQPTGQFFHIAADTRSPYWIYGSQQDSGALGTASRSLYREISFRDWHPVAGGENGYIVPDPLDPNFIFAGSLVRYNQATGETMRLSPAVSGGRGGLRQSAEKPIVFSPADPHALYVASDVLYKSSDHGEHWQAVSPSLARSAAGGGGRGGAISSIAPSPLAANTIWVSTNDGAIQVTEDGGKTWRNVTPPDVPAGSSIPIIEASRADVHTAYAAVDRHLQEDFKPYFFRTTDSGKTWQKIVDGIPDGSFARVIREDLRRPGLLYAGTETGMFVSFDNGSHWQSLQLNLPFTSVRDIALHGDDIVAGTYGRSMWILDDVTPLRQIQPRMADAGAYLFAPAPAVHTPPGTGGTPLPPDTPAAANPPAGATIDYYLRANAKKVSIEILDGEGHVVSQYSSDAKVPVPAVPANVTDQWVRHLEPLPAAAGMHRVVWDLRKSAASSQTQDQGRRQPASRGPAGERPLTVSAYQQANPTWPAGATDVAPGNYSVRLTVDGRTYTQPLSVEAEAR